MKNLIWIQNWFESNCDGEHEHQIKILTVDNPGWNVIIEFENSTMNIEDSEWILVDNGDADWYGWKVTNGVFEASGDVKKLDFLFSIFKKMIDDNEE